MMSNKIWQKLEKKTLWDSVNDGDKQIIQKCFSFHFHELTAKLDPHSEERQLSEL